MQPPASLLLPRCAVIFRSVPHIDTALWRPLLRVRNVPACVCGDCAALCCLARLHVWQRRMQITSNSYQAYFIPIASVANTLKGISGLASSSSRAALHVSFARGENIADITAKSHSQFIFSYLSGTVAGILVAGSIDKTDTVTAVYAALVLTAITAVTSHIAIRTVPLANLNSSRLQLLLEHYVRVNAAMARPTTIRMPHPPELCASDPVATLSVQPWSSMFCPAIELNRPIQDLLPHCVDESAEKLRMLLEVHRGNTHLLMRDGRARTSRLHVLLREDATPEDAIMAMLHAVLVRCVLRLPGAVADARTPRCGAHDSSSSLIRHRCAVQAQARQAHSEQAQA